MSIRIIFSALVLFFFTLVFQNCNNVEFSPADSRLTKVDPNNEVAQDLGDGESGTGDEGDNVVKNQDDDDNVVKNEDDDDKEIETCKDRKHRHHRERRLASSGDGEYICVLEGAGKSARLGFIDNALKEHGKTPHVVCMSKEACENIVSRKFAVKSAERRGFCPHKNKHVIAIDDEQMEKMIGN